MSFSLVPKDHPVFGAWLIGIVLGWLAGIAGWGDFLRISRESYEPLPHQISKYPGGISLRFAMVHDVIHERFEKHGEAYYRQRNQLALGQLKTVAATTQPADKAWRLMDDLAVGHVHLGEFDQAIAIMRDKLAKQELAGIAGGDLYSTYANLGTAMMIEAIVKSAGGKDSSDELKESLTWVRKSIEVNPQAHFGREVWQVMLGEFLLATAKNPKLLGEYDFVGNYVGEIRPTRTDPVDGRPEYAVRATRVALQSPQLTEDQRGYIRDRITKVGSLTNRTSNSFPVPFDEPVLGIVGMWRYGGGANPHFSLGLAETMRLVGQPHIAWAAYERTTMLLNDLQNKEEAKFLTEHCRDAQSNIESNLPESPATLRAAFKADLKAGLDYQAAYQQFEAEQIANGVSIDDPHFYDEFLAAHRKIASDPGDADFIRVMTDDFGTRFVVPAILLGGLFSFITAAIRRRSKVELAAAPQSAV